MYVDTQQPTSFLDLTKPSLVALSHILRRRELWPEDFEWYYASCASCAMGLAHRLWALCDHPTRWNATNVMHDVFGIDARNTERIFLGKAFPKNEYFGITPEMVADKIDEYLASR